LRQCQQIVGHYPRFVDTAVHVDLNADLQGGQAIGALLAQALRDFEPVDRLHPVKMLGHQPGFVALQRSDAMPLDRG
jgi:hypothetical protein